jgi:hypothetical protein
LVVGRVNKFLPRNVNEVEMANASDLIAQVNLQFHEEFQGTSELLPAGLRIAAENYRARRNGHLLNNPNSTKPWPQQQSKHQIPLGISLPAGFGLW